MPPQITGYVVNVRVLGAVLAVAWLSFMAWRHTDLVTDRSAWIRDCEVDEDCAGRRVFLALVTVMSVEDEQYTVRKLEDDHLIQGVHPELEVGETVSVIAGWEGERLVEQELTRHPWRPYKSGLGLIGLGLTVVVLVGGFRWENGVVPRG